MRPAIGNLKIKLTLGKKIIPFKGKGAIPPELTITLARINRGPKILGKRGRKNFSGGRKINPKKPP